MFNDRSAETTHQLTILSWQMFVIFGLAFAIRLTDEHYHLLASHSWLENGNYRILDGEYVRARIYTILIATFAYIFQNDGLFIARLPSILAGSALIAAVFFWLHNVAEKKVAWTASLLLCFADMSIQISQFARFYALQALLIWVASAVVYSLITSTWNHRRSPLKLAVALLVSLVSIHLQITSVIAFAALMMWAAIDYISQPKGKLLLKKHSWLWFVAAIFITFVLFHDKIETLLEQYKYTPLWAKSTSESMMYYYWTFGFSMPIFWYLLPIASLIAISRWTRPALFCIVMLAVPLVVHSFGGMKSYRYVYYALPYFFALWGMATVVMAPKLWGLVDKSISSLESYLSIAIPSSSRARVITGICVVISGIGLLSNSMYRSTWHTLRVNLMALATEPISIFIDPADGNWMGKIDALKHAIGKPSVFITTDDLRTISYLGDYDYLLNATILSDIKSWQDFQVDFRTGRPIVASGEAIREIIECFKDGVILIPDNYWRRISLVNDNAADVIEKMTTPYSAVAGFKIFKWNHAVAPALCPQLTNVNKAKHADKHS